MFFRTRPLPRSLTLLLICVATFAGGLTGSLNGAPALAQGCVQVDWDPSSCSNGAINNSSVDIWGQQSNYWNENEGGLSGSSIGGSGTSDSSGDGGAPREPTFFEMCMQDAYFASAVVECMAVISQWTPAVPAVPVPTPVIRSITLADLASFTPEGVSVRLEPGTWTVVGVNTNFIAATSTHVVSSSLLGRSAEVRFTPASFDWNYGDGAFRTTDNPGASWGVLGLKEFARTSTSHVYRTPAQFTPTVTVWYRVEYRWGGGTWQSVAGRVGSSASASTVTVFTADTVLVTGACDPWRSAPGC